MSIAVSADAPTKSIGLPGATIAYRTMGGSDSVPLVLTHRFRGTMDHWDPALLDVLARERRVIVFDNLGVGASSGSSASSITGMAQSAAAFIAALGHDQVDVLGWSMGGAVAQRLALSAPGLVRRLVLAGTGPGAVPDPPPTPDKVWQIAAKPVNEDEDFLYLFFTGTGKSRSAGLASLRRLDERLTASQSAVEPATVNAQITAIRAYGAGSDSTYQHLHKIAVPVFVANGAHDIMVHPYNSYVLSQRLPDAQLILYPDSGHGFLFQYPEIFGQHVLEFLR